MNILKEIRSFLREEKIFSWLLLAVLCIYAFVVFAKGSAAEEPSSPAMEKVRQIQKTFAKDKSEQEAIEEVLRKDPSAAVALFCLGAVFMLILAGGLWVDTCVITNYFYKNPSIHPVREHETVPWGGRDVVKVIILFLLTGFVLSLSFGFLRSFVFKELSQNAFIIAGTTVNDVSLLAFIFYFVFKKYGKKPEDLGLSFKQGGKDILLGICGYLGTLPVFVIVLVTLVAIANLFSYEPQAHPLVEVFVEEDKKNPLLIGYSLFLACAIGPLIEEIFFRGFLYPALRKIWGILPAMAGTAVFFAFVHHSTFAFAPIFVLGMILCYLYEKRGTLIPSMTLHVIHNSLFIAYFFVMKRVFLDKFL